MWINFVRKKLIIHAGYLLFEWLEFVVAVWEKSGNYFLRTLWQPCNYIHCNVRDEVTYPSSKFKYENQVWESSLRIGPNSASKNRVRLSRPTIASDYRVRISRLNIASEYRVWISSPKIKPENGVLEVWEWISNLIPHLTGQMITYPC